jgi:predicted sugar kinase
VSPAEVAKRLFRLTDEEVHLIFEVLVPALAERDEDAAREAVERLASMRGEEFWRRIAGGARGWRGA